MQINYLLFLFLLTISSLQPFSIVIDPAGDARTPGRVIGDSFERSITYDLALLLKKEFELRGHNLFLTRSAYQNVAPLQQATFANRINPDLYISLHCYNDPDQKFCMALYTMSHGEPLITATPTISLMPLSKTHLLKKESTHLIVTDIYATLSEKYGRQFIISPPIALPLVPLIGITAPAITIELNCHQHDDIMQYSIALVDALTNVFTS